MEILFCDRCTASIPLVAMSEGKAQTREWGRVCGKCVEELGGANGGALQCEGCGNPVDEEDAVGRLVDRRLLCGNCHSVPTSQVGLRTGSLREESRPGFLRVLRAPTNLLLFGFVGSFLLTVICLGLLVRQEGSLFELLATGDSRSEGTEDQRRIDPTPEPGPAQDNSALESMQEQLADLRRQLDQITERQVAVEELEAIMSSLTLLSAEFVRWKSQIAATMDGLDEDAIFRSSLLDDVARRLSDFEERLQAQETLLESTALRQSDTADSQPEESSAESAELKTWLDALGDDDAGVRFSAVVELGRLRSLRAVPPLGEALVSDPDPYVREQAARTLAVFRERGAGRWLVQALEDPAETVALEAAATLQKLARKNFGFTEKASKSERKAALSKWEEWWSQESSNGGS